MLLTIVIPAFNAADFISTSINSLKHQSNKDFEVIIVDDGSIDQTADVTERLLIESKIPAYQIVKKTNGGVSSARNLGLREAKGEYVFFLDADDYIDPNLVQHVNEIVKNNCPQIVNWIFENVNSEMENISHYFDKIQAVSGTRSGSEMLDEVLIKTDVYLWTGSLVFSRSFLISNQLEFTEGCFSGEDTEFILKSVCLAKEVFFIKKVLSYYVKREGSITNSYNVRKFDAIMALKRTGRYIQEINNPKLKNISNFILENLTLEAYMIHYEKCISYLLKMETQDLNVAIKKLENDIESNYENLSINMKNLIRLRKNRSLKYNIAVLIFKISPNLYFKMKRAVNIIR